MNINFRQGIITYPISANEQQFLTRTGTSINLNIPDRSRVDITFASGTQDYLYTETLSVPNAWTDVEPATDTWLYWDLDVKTGLRTFGSTTLIPTVSPLQPTSAAEGQHWFNLITKQMMVYQNGRWTRKIRAFAAKINSSLITPMGSNPLAPFAGSQVGLVDIQTETSYIVYDEAGKPIIRSNGDFFTLSSPLFARGVPVNNVKLDTNVVFAKATEPVAKFQVVRLSNFDEFELCDYLDVKDSLVGMVIDDLGAEELGRIIPQGVIVNPDWDWTTPGTLLWVKDNGLLVEYDPHTDDIDNYPVSNPPVARVLSRTSVLFNQALGEKGERGIRGQDGEQGPQGPQGTVDVNSIIASPNALGVVRLSVPATEPVAPVVVETNDPRMTDARPPLPHSHDINEISGLQATITSVLNYVDSQLANPSQQQYDLNFFVAGTLETPEMVVGSYIANRPQTILATNAPISTAFGDGTGLAKHRATSEIESMSYALINIITVVNGAETLIGNINLVENSTTHAVVIPTSVDIQPGTLVQLVVADPSDIMVEDLTVNIMTLIDIKYLHD